MNKTYTIQKVGRARVDRPDSYYGPTWDTAGLRSRYRKRYTDRQEAQAIADQLAAHNPVGFLVIEYHAAPR